MINFFVSYVFLVKVLSGKFDFELNFEKLFYVFVIVYFLLVRLLVVSVMCMDNFDCLFFEINFCVDI